ncbi:unnamed protein product [Moneuplotes crassus]|uniref:AP2/ERF domain-containing protein n=1 Tax=Euplotes crassus TaxID=5936 RepID=A0AAD2DCX5_EUPCR|nr:unnamed protein product [Moneuplotes crassus]
MDTFDFRPYKSSIERTFEWQKPQELIFELNPYLDFKPAQNIFKNGLLSQYCDCTESTRKNSNESLNQSLCETKKTSKKSRKAMITDRLNFSINLDSLYTQLDMFGSLDSVVTTGRKKSDRQENRSLRRSSYIGLSKNGHHWQAMISINKRKTYIGTYENQLDGSKAFDFYSILVHGLGAKVNNSYTKEEVLEMIEKFKDPENDNNF